jgi:hypothetical protein
MQALPPLSPCRVECIVVIKLDASQFVCAVSSLVPVDKLLVLRPDWIHSNFFKKNWFFEEGIESWFPKKFGLEYLKISF